MLNLGKKNVLGILIDAVDYEAAISFVFERARQKRGAMISALAVHGVMTGVRDPEHKFRLNSFDLLVPDGQPVRWVMNWLYGTKMLDRVYGPELMRKICERAASEGTPIYLYGSTKPVVTSLTESLTRMFPGNQYCWLRALSVPQAEPAGEDCSPAADPFEWRLHHLCRAGLPPTGNFRLRIPRQSFSSGTGGRRCFPAFGRDVAPSSTVDAALRAGMAISPPCRATSIVAPLSLPESCISRACDFAALWSEAFLSSRPPTGQGGSWLADVSKGGRLRNFLGRVGSLWALGPDVPSFARIRSHLLAQ